MIEFKLKKKTNEKKKSEKNNITMNNNIKNNTVKAPSHLAYTRHRPTLRRGFAFFPCKK
jgi:hypothetical protein